MNQVRSTPVMPIDHSLLNKMQCDTLSNVFWCQIDNAVCWGQLMIWSENINICCNVEQLYSKCGLIALLIWMSIKNGQAKAWQLGQTASSGPGLTNFTCNYNWSLWKLKSLLKALKSSTIKYSKFQNSTQYSMQMTSPKCENN